jgi:beta-lactamase superfamily II metal-dependent hydrolase
MERRRWVCICLLLLLAGGFWIWTQNADTPQEEKLIITAFPVGKADAILIQEGNTSILIDTGEAEDGPQLLNELEERGISKLDLLLVTHFDKDHVGSASYLMEHLEAESILMPDYEGDRPEYTAFMESLADHMETQRVDTIQNLSLDELSLVIYPAENPQEIFEEKAEYDNDLSLVVSLTYGKCRFLLTGDIEKTRIRQMLSSDVDWQHDWIKMPHHGRYQKALKDLLEAVKPSWAVISCSEEVPAEEKTLELLQKKKIPVWDTSLHPVVTTCDGMSIKVDYGQTEK